MNTKALFHDMTLDYLRPAEPDKNRKTQVRFRCSKEDDVDVTLVWGNDRVTMRRSESDGEFIYFDAGVKTGNGAVPYYFEIKAQDGNWTFYDKRGCCRTMSLNNRAAREKSKKIKIYCF